VTDLNGQHAVIVGGSSGIGLASARRLAHAGAKVTIVSRSRDRLDAAAPTIAGEVDTAVLDCTDESAVRSLFARLGSFDHLVSSVGDKAVDAPVRTLDTDVARRVFEVKYWGQYFTAKHAADRLSANGSITMISAWLARKPTAGFPTYAAIDGAIESLAKTLSLELAPIRVNVVSPGVIDTPLFDNLPDDARAATFDGVAARLPLGRIGDPDEVARAVEYLIGNPYSTGAVVDVDGGWA
jgi:NAD(P)-dependent dehydrogenase (short-subunit alcohol dehydrogenase family)